MDRLGQRLSVAAQALETLRELSGLEAPSRVERDAAIQRFKNSWETVWKAARLFLRTYEGVEVGSPKASVRAARDAGLLSRDHAEAALAMADDRNLTVHIYNEALAKEIFRRLAGHARLMGTWMDGMTKRVAAPKRSDRPDC